MASRDILDGITSYLFHSGGVFYFVTLGVCPLGSAWSSESVQAEFKGDTSASPCSCSCRPARRKDTHRRSSNPIAGPATASQGAIEADEAQRCHPAHRGAYTIPSSGVRRGVRAEDKVVSQVKRRIDEVDPQQLFRRGCRPRPATEWPEGFPQATSTGGKLATNDEGKWSELTACS